MCTLLSQLQVLHPRRRREPAGRRAARAAASAATLRRTRAPVVPACVARLAPRGSATLARGAAARKRALAGAAPPSALQATAEAGARTVHDMAAVAREDLRP